MAIERSIAKDFHDLMKNIKSFSDGQATISDWDDENLGTFEVTIAPNDGLYKEGEFVFKIVCDSVEDPPRVYCQTAIYHPNIDTMTDPDGEICINLFDCDVWNSNCSMQDVVQGLLFLMYEPNVEDPLNSAISCSMNLEEFGENVQKTIAGERVGDYLFPVNPRYARLHPAEEESERKDEEVEMEKGDGKGDNDGEGGKVRKAVEDDQKEDRIEDLKNCNEERTEDEQEIEKKAEKEVEYEDRYFGIKVVVSGYSDDEVYYDDEEDDDEEEDEDDQMDSDIENEDIIVNDEELDDIIEKLNDRDAFVDDENQKNLDSTESVVSWSRMFYGANNRANSDQTQILIENQSNGPGPTSQGACKEPETSPGPSICMMRTPGKVHIPTVTTRFYNALQTRIFRRWLV